MVYCGYIGGSSHDSSGDIAVDRAGNAYVTGFTDSDNQTFPVKVGPDLAHYSGEDAFVAKVNAQGTALVYCGYIGGSASERGYGIAVDSAGNAYVTGETGYVRNDFPVKVGPDLTHNGYYDAFVAKVNAQGTALVYCGYIGGSYLDVGYGIAVDSAGSAYVTGLTASTEATFPVKLGPDLISNGGADAFVAKVSASGMGLDYCGFVGGSNADEGRAIAVDGSGNAYVAGSTWSTEATFPVKGGPDLTSNGGEDAFVAKVDAQGKALEYCGYIGGNGWDIGNGIAVGAAGTAFVSGITFSTEQTFPVKGGPDLTHNGGIWDAFVAKVNAQGTALAYCGYIGGNGYDYGGRVATDAAGFAYVAGWTESDQQTFPVAVGPDLTHNGGVRDAFVAKVAAQGTGLVYCGYIGGSGEELGGGIAVDPSGNAHVAGWTRSTEQTFPVTVGPDVTHNSPLGQADAFVAKIVLTLLQASGPPRPGGTEILTLTATQDAGLSFQLGSSLGTGPIPIDTRQIDLSPDGLLAVSVGGWWPPVFQGYQGIIDPNGQAQAAIHIPNFPALIGLRLHTAFVTLDPQAPSGIKSISNTFSFTITK
jgi:hypothetical protein